MYYSVGNSGGETSGMMTHQLLFESDVKRNDLIINFNNTGDEHNATLDFLDKQQREWCVEYHWLEYDFVSGFADAVLRKPATYDALSECVANGTGFAGMYHTDVLDKIRWNEEFKSKITVNKAVREIAVKTPFLFSTSYWDDLEVVADYKRCMADFYELFNTSRGKLTHRFKQVNYRSADRGGIPFLKTLLYKNAIRYVKRLPYVVPNPAQRFSTGDLKIKVAEDFLKSIGLTVGKDCVKVIGIRYDEPKRYYGNYDPGAVYMPLFEQQTTSDDVKRFWDDQRFELSIRHEKWLGNCVDCYLKTELKRIKACQSSPIHFQRRNVIEKAANEVMRRDVSAERILNLAQVSNITVDDIKADTAEQMECMCG